MSIVPVIGRELRSQSRQPLTFLLRLAGAASIALAFWLAFSSLHPPLRISNYPAPSQQQDFQNFGVALFGKMNLTIFLAIWLLTPLAAADSISRERRKGTLPLLQLTRLRPWEIVLGKSFVHLLRSSTLFLTMVPWLLIPFLFGGLSLQDLRLALLLDASALFLAQSAGLLASTFSRDWLKSVIWAEVLALLLLLAMMNRYEIILDRAFTNGAVPAVSRFPLGAWRPPQPIGLWEHMSYPNGFLEKRSALLGLLTSGDVEYQNQNQWFTGVYSLEFQSAWQRLWLALNPQGKLLWRNGAVTMLAGSIAVFVLAILLGAAYVQRSWRESSPGAAWERLRLQYFTPKYGVSSLRQRLSRSLSRNPIGWLHHYSPSARLTKWSWCLFLIGIETFFVGNVQDLYTAQAGLSFLLLLGLLFSSTGSFRNELETGAFELLLVTPLREGQILLGRVGGIWRQFLPAFVIYAAGALFLASGWTDKTIGPAAVESVLWTALLFISAPFIGLYFSLLRWNFLVAWIMASFVALLLPVFLRGNREFGAPLLILGQFGVAAFFAWRIRSRLQNRLALSQTAREANAA